MLKPSSFSLDETCFFLVGCSFGASSVALIERLILFFSSSISRILTLTSWPTSKKSWISLTKPCVISEI
ncbi:putative RNA degradation protein [Listeria monocytogenes]|nr:putative RNA degradation protein [Listeria monocytogenes]